MYYGHRMEPTCNVLVMHTKENVKMRLANQDFQGSKDNRTTHKLL